MEDEEISRRDLIYTAGMEAKKVYAEKEIKRSYHFLLI
jgi:hypothetical protein